MKDFIMSLFALLVILIALLLLQGCGRKTEVVTVTDTNYVDKEVVVEVTKAQKYEGVFVFDNNSQIELVAGEDADVYVLRDGQYLNTINPENGTIGNFPTFDIRGLRENSGKLFISMNVNYTSGHDIEEDISGSDIVGSRKTDITILFDENDKLVLTFEIYSSNINNNINYIVAKRVFTEL